MRSLLPAISMLLATVAAQAQSTPPSTVKPKQTATVPARPAVQRPADTANAMPQAERQAIQSDLAWVGEYNGAITGDVSERMVEAIKEYQKLSGGKPTGVLNQKERGVLAETAKRRQDNAAGRSSPTAQPALGSASRPSWCRSRLPMPQGRDGVRRTGLSRSCSPDARRQAQPPRSSPSGKRRSRPDAMSITWWSSRISSCSRGCRV